MKNVFGAGLGQGKAEVKTASNDFIVHVMVGSEGCAVDTSLADSISSVQDALEKLPGILKNAPGEPRKAILHHYR